MWDPYAEFEATTLPNGLAIHTAYWPGREVEHIAILIHSGAEQDPVGLEGTAHFVEHLVSANADRSAESIFDFFTDHGGYAELGATGYPNTYYRCCLPTDPAAIADAMSIFGRMLIGSSLTEHVERERHVIIGEFQHHYPTQIRFDNDMRECRALFSGFRMGRSTHPLGTPESIGHITAADTQSYYDTHYTPANISIVAVGGMTAEQITALIAGSPFCQTKSGKRTALPAPMADVPAPTETRHVFRISEHMTAVHENPSGAYYSSALIPATINTHAINFFCIMLEKTLLAHIREQRAWAYDIDSCYADCNRYSQLDIRCPALAPIGISGIDDLIEECIALTGQNEELFVQTKRRVLARQRTMDTTAGSVCNTAVDELANRGRIISLAEGRREIESVTMDDLRAILPWIRPERRWTMLTIP